MELKGHNFIASDHSAQGEVTFQAVNPANGKEIAPPFTEATEAEILEAVVSAEDAFSRYGQKSGEERALFLESIGEEILNLGEALIERCQLESGLPEGRLKGERGRTVNQLKLFANLIREGSWQDARIDSAAPDRQPIPKPDIRSILRPLGPVGIFGASNFPLAFSVAGGDTASALAAGCTVVVKAHPAHPGTCEMIASAITKAIEKTNMPAGTFSMVHGPSYEVGQAIVKHPFIKAIGFTGSFKGGKAIFDVAGRRDEPIPVYAEMGSTNPVFILPGALHENRSEIAKGLASSVTLGVGQFCTNPGLVFMQNSTESTEFKEMAASSIEETGAGTMLTGGIQHAYHQGVQELSEQEGIEVLATGGTGDDGFPGTPYLLQTMASAFLTNDQWEDEVFGPSTLTVTAEDKQELIKAAKKLKGHLTATIFATDEDLDNYQDLIAILEHKVGRLIINGYPTGVEVCHAMVHGGPFPATTDSRTTSVGTGAITRFTRPVCYQGFPQTLLPKGLQDGNPLSIWRLVDGDRVK